VAQHLADHDFWKAYNELPQAIRKQADKSFEQLKKNPNHPSLYFKKIGRRWSARVGIDYRALALETDGGFLWYWIGSHSEYDRLIGKT
jgi:hypothetical protein